MSLDDFLSFLAIVLTPFSLLSTVILVRAAMIPPRIGALVERATIGAVIAAMVSSGALVTINRITGYSLWPVEVSRIIFLLSLIALALVPVAWLYLWATGRLGGGEA